MKVEFANVANYERTLQTLHLSDSGLGLLKLGGYKCGKGRKTLAEKRSEELKEQKCASRLAE